MTYLIHQTNDGSHTLSNGGETYHSQHGAIQESQHVYIESGLMKISSNDSTSPIHVLEVGFGTGLNALLTLLAPQTSPILYTTFEPNPISKSIWEQLNYYEECQSSLKLFHTMHMADWNSNVTISPSFTLHKKNTPFTCNVSGLLPVDVVYFDPFSPNSEPTLWTEPIFHALFQLMSAQAVLVTYCAKGIVKTRLRHAGFRVERLPGPPGKRHMIRAHR